MKPQPRPALKRADDADLHPALSVAPTQMVPRAPREAAGSADVVNPAAKSKGSKAKAKGKGKGKKGQKDLGPYRSAGRATSDVLRHGKDSAKQVKLKVTVPKRVRSELRAIAENGETSVDEIVSQALVEWLGDPRRW